MPQAIPLIIYAVATEAGVAGAAYYYLAATIAVSLYESKETKSDAKNDYKQRKVVLDANVRSAAQPWTFAYGKTVLGGLNSYANTGIVFIGNVGTNDNYQLWFIDTHVAHPSEDIIDLYYGNDVITDAADIDWGANNVTAGPYGITAHGEYALRVWKRLGVSNTYIADLASQFPADITTAFKGEGYTWSAHRLCLFSASKTLWESKGVPGPRRVLGKWKSNIYDPRLDTSPGANPTNPTYQAWTDNPILCIIDAMRTLPKKPVSASRIDWASVVTEANICDELVTVPTGGSPATRTQKRYTLNGAFVVEPNFNSILDQMQTSCLGKRVYSSGKWRVYAGAYRSPTVTLTAADVVGEVTETTKTDGRDRYNSVRGTFLSAADQYIETTYSPVSISAYVTRDNGDVLWRDFPMPFTDDDLRAQNIAYKLCLQSDQQLVLTVPVRWTGMKVTPETYVTFSYGPYSSKIFRCTNWKQGDSKAPVYLVLREDSSTAWGDLAPADYTTRNSHGVITKGSPEAPPHSATLLPNLLPLGYADFERITNTQLALVFVNVPDGGSGISTDQAWLGTQSIKIWQTSTSSNSGVNIILSGTDISGGYGNIAVLPARRYLMIVSVYPNNARFQAGHLRPYLQASSQVYKDRELADCPVGEWTRVAIELDATATSWKKAAVQLSWISDGVSNSTDPIGYIDGAVLIDVTDRPDLTETDFPLAFIPAGGSAAGAIGLDGGAMIMSGVGSPETVVVAPVGSLYLRSDGGTSTTLYIKQSGSSNTGWVAK